MTLTIFAISTFIPFMAEMSALIRFAISSIFGIIAVARSPFSAIAIISETNSKSEYSDKILSVTIVTDVVTLFGIVVSFCQVILSTGRSIDLSFIFYLIFEIFIAFIIGFFLGRSIVYLIRTVKVELPVVILGVGFMVVKFSCFLAEYLYYTHDIVLNLEPLLICMAAGFTIQNFSKQGKTFLIKMDRVSLPIYRIFCHYRCFYRCRCFKNQLDIGDCRSYFTHYNDIHQFIFLWKVYWRQTRDL